MESDGGERGVVDSDDWRKQGGMGEGGGLVTDGRGRSSAAGPLSSVGACCPWVGGSLLAVCASC